jgi:hypothetical protein
MTMDEPGWMPQDVEQAKAYLAKHKLEGGGDESTMDHCQRMVEEKNARSGFSGRTVPASPPRPEE